MALLSSLFMDLALILKPRWRCSCFFCLHYPFYEMILHQFRKNVITCTSHVALENLLRKVWPKSANWAGMNCTQIGISLCQLYRLSRGNLALLKHQNMCRSRDHYSIAATPSCDAINEEGFDELAYQKIRNVNILAGINFDFPKKSCRNIAFVWTWTFIWDDYHHWWLVSLWNLGGLTTFVTSYSFHAMFFHNSVDMALTIYGSIPDIRHHRTPPHYLNCAPAVR